MKVHNALVVKSFGFSMLSRTVIFSLKFITIPILARLLSASELGAAAAAMTIVLFLIQVGGAGFSAALVIQKAEDSEVWHSVFWTNLAVGLALAGLIFWQAGTIAGLMSAPSAEPLLRALSLLFPISLSTQVGLALLIRKMQFQKEMMCSLTAEFLGAAAAIFAAYRGYGVWALVIQQFVSGIALLIGVSIAARYRPALVLVPAKLRQLLRFSLGNLGADLANFVTFQGPLLVVARLLGVAEAGGYSIASRLSDIPNQVILVALMSVLFPTFSSMSHDPERKRRALLRTTQATTLILAPIMFGLWALAEPLTTILLGPKWTYMWPVFGLLALGKGVMSPCGSFIPFMKGIGRGDALWWFALGRAVATVICTAVGAAIWGLYAATLILAIANCVIMAAYAVTVFRAADIDIRLGLRNIGGPLVIALIMAGFARFSYVATEPYLGGPLVAVGTISIIAIVVYAGLLLLFEREFCREQLQMMLKLRPAR